MAFPVLDIIPCLSDFSLRGLNKHQLGNFKIHFNFLTGNSLSQVIVITNRKEGYAGLAGNHVLMRPEIGK